MPLDVEHFGRRAKTHLSGLDVLEDRWLLSAGIAAGEPPSGAPVAAIAETSNTIEVTATLLQPDYGSISSDGSPDALSLTTVSASAGPGQAPAANGAVALVIAQPYAVSSLALTAAVNAGSGTGQASGGSAAIPLTGSAVPVPLTADMLVAVDAPIEMTAAGAVGIIQPPAALGTLSVIPGDGRTSPIIRSAFKRVMKIPLAWSPPFNEPSTPTTAGERTGQPSSNVLDVELDDANEDAETALVPQSDDEPVFLADAVIAQAVTVKADFRHSESGVQDFTPYTRRNRDRSTPGCIAPAILPASDAVDAVGSRRLPNVPATSHPVRPADLLDRFVPFDRTELERSVDRVLARFGELETGTASVHSGDWRLVLSIVPPAALGAAAIFHYHRRRGPNDDREASDGVASYALGLPGHPRDWVCEPR